jgi:predicted DNA-binding protein (UPF0251 family)
MNDRNRVVELLKNYRSYRYAVSNGIAPHVADDTAGMPMGGSYGPRVPSLLRGSWDVPTDDYRRYSRAVKMVEGAVSEVLDDNESIIISMKYMERNSLTLEKIAERTGISERTIKSYHKRALTKLTVCLRFVDTPEIINLDDVIKVV